MSSRSLTLLGCLSVVIWASSFGFLGIGTEKLGAFMFQGLISTTGGIFLCLLMIARGGFLQMFANPTTYYLICGVPYALYMGLFSLAFKLGNTDADIILLTAINNTWPQLMSVFSIVFLGMCWKRALLFALLLSVVCLFVVDFKSGMNVGDLFTSLFEDCGVCLAALACACLWALYSTFSKSYADRGLSCTSQPLFLVASGIFNISLHFVVGETTPSLSTVWDVRFACMFVYCSLVTNSLAFLGWDAACRGGHLPSVNAFAYLKAILATMFSTLELGMQPTVGMGIGSFGITISAILAAKSVFPPSSTEELLTQREPSDSAYQGEAKVVDLRAV